MYKDGYMICCNELVGIERCGSECRCEMLTIEQ